MKATNLADVLRYFDPKKPLTDHQLDDWFVERAGQARELLKISLTLQDELQKILFVGHRGSGKSTELNKLAEEIEDQYHVISFDTLNLTGRTNLEYEDLMLSISTQVMRSCIQEGLVERPLSEPLVRRWEELRDWWHRVVAGLEFQPSPAEAEVKMQLNMLLGQVELGARQSSIARDELKAQISRQMPELIRNLNWVISEAEENGKRLLIIIEGLDKIDLDSAASIFRDHAPTITAPKATMIYTFPVALRHSDHANTIRLSFSGLHFLSNMATRQADGTENPQGVASLREVVLARMEPQLIESAALDLLVQANGGIPVWLVFLMRTAALYALARDTAAVQITVADAHNAIKDLRRDILLSLTRHDLDVLRARHADRQLTNDADEQRLLYNGSLIEYSNGELWCDAHPALWSILEQTGDDNSGTES